MYPLSYSISNFRSIKDPEFVSIRPITLFIGPNSGGKSTLIEALRVFRDSFVKYGSINYHGGQYWGWPVIYAHEVLNYGLASSYIDKQKPISFWIEPINYFMENEVSDRVKSWPNFEIAYLFRLSSTLDIVNPNENQNEHAKIETLECYGFDLYCNGFKILSYYESYDDQDMDIPSINIQISFAKQLLLKLDTGSLEAFNEEESQIDSANINRMWHLSSDVGVSELFVSELRSSGINISEDTIKELIHLVYHPLSKFYRWEITPVKLNRSNNHRRRFDADSNSYLQDFVRNYFDHGLSTTHYLLKDILPIFDLPDKFKLKLLPEGGFGFYLKHSDNEWRNLADYGSGINQLLPLFLLTGTIDPTPFKFDNGELKELIRKFIYIEEPEMNLHPNFQSQLAVMFKNLKQKLNLNFIIETHSEYMTRKFQELVAIGEIQPYEIVINYCWKDGETTRVKQIYIDEKGQLSDEFGKGFYDESMNLKFNLFELRNMN